ncbi:hypothetical protein PHLCEN_2v816 [Hermanssonia centrifuga]|uniref:L-2-hydroxyglutarate dehydrogenase, mitochondrial n=1 Tax=Hermanssonia centrifuga TaxID=98765 RepID=A0A2R6S542_9APHY|nr:hypothetical protein PHLCEN_2v816 [Hermanssonia centrifuga]
MRLCLRGRDLLYEHCEGSNVPYQKTGKLVVAQEHQRPYIENLHAKVQNLSWPVHSSVEHARRAVLPTKLIEGDEARVLEPDLSKSIAAALWSPETGIIDSHSLMESFEKDITESEGGELVYSTRVVRVDPALTPEKGWVVQTVTSDSEEGDALLARTLINASGLAGPMILNSLLPREKRIAMYYARGSYASYKGPGTSYISHLIYPCPGTGRTEHGFQSLGTHLTLDMQGNIKFGPDLDWLDPPPIEETDEGIEHADPDFWTRHLVPDESRLKMMHEAITEYLPEISLEGLQPDYCGIRPKLVGPEGGFQDFVFRTDYPENFSSTGGGSCGELENPMITLMGIESPGLTSCLAIAEMVVDDMLGGKDEA